MLIEDLGAFIKAVGKKTYYILSRSSDNEQGELMGDIEYPYDPETIDHELLESKTVSIKDNEQ